MLEEMALEDYALEDYKEGGEVTEEAIHKAKKILSLSQVLNKELTKVQVDEAYNFIAGKLRGASLYPLPYTVKKNLDSARDILFAVIANPGSYPDPAEVAVVVNPEPDPVEVGVIRKSAATIGGFFSSGYQRVTGKEYVFGDISKTTGAVVVQTAKAAGAVAAQVAGTMAVQTAQVAGTVANRGGAALSRAAAATASTIASEYERNTGKKYYPGAVIVDSATQLFHASSSGATVVANAARAVLAGDASTPVVKSSDAGSDSEITQIAERTPSLGI